MNTRNRFRKISLLLTAALVFSGCGTEAQDTAQETSSAIAVKAVEAELGTMAVSNQFIGTVSPQQQVSIVPLVSGEVDAVYAEVGDEVKAGDVLFHIKDEAARLQKESAELSKQGAELSAQMQLGSAQVMNNISMQSNIRSLEYQLEMAKDQYNSAVNGIADAQEAKDEMNSAIDEINHSVKKLQKDQEEMEEVINRAKKYVTYDLLEGEYVYETAYNRPENPDHYTWGQELAGRGEESETEESETVTVEEDADKQALPAAGLSAFEREEPSEPEEISGTGKKPVTEENSKTDGLPETKEDTAADGAGEKAPETAAGGEGEKAPETAAGGEREKTPETAAGGDSEKAPETVTDSAAENTLNEAATVSEESTPEEATSGGGDEKAVAGAPKTADYAYFSVEIIRDETPQYLAEADDVNDLSYVPSLTKSKEEAWDAYYRQQEINAAARAAKEMGYSAEDIGSGKAQAELLENSAQIVALQYQASQLQSNQASVDSSIKSAESAKDTTAKTIDFYEDNLENAQVTYGISNGQAYQDTAGALATQIQAADVGVRSAQMQLEYYSPTTPISGTVVSKTVEKYGLVQPGYAAYVISNQDAMNVTFAVSGQVKESLHIGMPVTLEKSGSTYTGTITEIGETVDQQSGGLFVVKAVTEADGDKLAGGTAVKLTVDTFRSENAVMIPYDAVHFESEQAYVFAIVDHRAVRTPVTIGLMNDDMVEITEGITAGTQVVATWSSQLEDGAELRIIGEKQGSGTASGDEEAERDSGTAAETQDAAETETEALSGEAGEADE